MQCVLDDDDYDDVNIYARVRVESHFESCVHEDAAVAVADAAIVSFILFMYMI